MKVKFPGGYMGRETMEKYIDPETVFELPDEAQHLIDVGLAVLVDKQIIIAEPERPKTTRAKRARKDGADEIK